MQSRPVLSRVWIYLQDVFSRSVKRKNHIILRTAVGWRFLFYPPGRAGKTARVKTADAWTFEKRAIQK
jgi:hypothetical protein